MSQAYTVAPGAVARTSGSSPPSADPRDVDDLEPTAAGGQSSGAGDELGLVGQNAMTVLAHRLDESIVAPELCCRNRWTHGSSLVHPTSAGLDGKD